MKKVIDIDERIDKQIKILIKYFGGTYSENFNKLVNDLLDKQGKQYIEKLRDLYYDLELK